MQQLSTTELKAVWRDHFKNDPPPHSSQAFLRGHLMWSMQAEQNGGLNPKVSRQLKRLMQQLRDDVNLTPQQTLIIKPGTRLLREYRGQKHEVIAEGNEFIYRGKPYRSLSRIARKITGTQWNGKLFFGVKQ